MNKAKQNLNLDHNDNIIYQEQKNQDKQYHFPYHYIPEFIDNDLSIVRYWPMLSCIYYLGRMNYILNIISNYSCNTLLDVGCGDGRFIREVYKKYPNINAQGIDYSETAIRLARALNQGINYNVINIEENQLSNTFDIVTLIEVLEHIPLDNVDTFSASVVSSVADSGTLIVTVPHTNVRLYKRHYQHFTSDTLKKTWEPYFNKIDIHLLHPDSRILGRISQLLGGKGKNYLITSRKIINWFYRLYESNYLLADKEKDARQLIAVCSDKK